MRVRGLPLSHGSATPLLPCPIEILQKPWIYAGSWLLLSHNSNFWKTASSPVFCSVPYKPLKNLEFMRIPKYPCPIGGLSQNPWYFLQDTHFVIQNAILLGRSLRPRFTHFSKHFTQKYSLFFLTKKAVEVFSKFLVKNYSTLNAFIFVIRNVGKPVKISLVERGSTWC